MKPKSKLMRCPPLTVLAVVVGLNSTVALAKADLTLNATGVADGFSLSTFVTGFSGPTSLFATAAATTSNGNVLVSVYNSAAFGGTGGTNIYSFTDADNQTLSDAIGVSTTLTSTAGAPGTIGALAYDNGTVYFGLNRYLYSLNNDGSINSQLLNGAQVTSGGLVSNPVNGHLYAGTNIDPGENIADINVQANTYQLYASPGGSAGAVSPDGTTLYFSHYPSVYAYNTTTFQPNWVSSGTNSRLGIVSSGAFAGDIIGFDETTGNLNLLNALTGSSTIIGTGGTLNGSGGNMGNDLTNGSLLLPQGDDILRISFGAAPEPSSIAGLALGISMLTLLSCRDRTKRTFKTLVGGP